MVLIALLYYLQLPVIVVDPVVITRCVYILQVHNLLRCSLPLVPTSTHPFVCLSGQDTLFHEFAPQPSGLLGVFEKKTEPNDRGASTRVSLRQFSGDFGWQGRSLGTRLSMPKRVHTSHHQFKALFVQWIDVRSHAIKIGVAGAQKHVTKISGGQSFGQRAAPDLVDPGK